jgi:hypothetical protein
MTDFQTKFLTQIFYKSDYRKLQDFRQTKSSKHLK